MSSQSGKWVVDTNVPVTANLACNPAAIPDEQAECVAACVKAINYVCGQGGLVIDDADEIISEYRKNLKLRGQPGVGDKFLKWVHDYGWTPKVDRVRITQSGHSYNEFPNLSGLAGFDNSDRKFVAVANAHVVKPPILQATDSKWWGWKDALAAAGIKVEFLCRDYIEKKYRKKTEA